MKHLLLAFLCCIPLVSWADASQQLGDLVGEYWANELREEPFMATHVGVRDYDAQVPSVAPEDYARRHNQNKATLAKLNAIDLVSLSEDDQLSAKILRFILKHKIELARFDSWRIPILADDGFHSEPTFLPRATRFKNEQDYRLYLTRVAKLPAFIDQNITNMRRGLKDGYTQPRQILDHIMPSFKALVTEKAAEHTLYSPFLTMPESIPQALQTSIQAEATLLFNDSVVPAYAKAYRFMQDEYLPGAVKRVGILHLPNGPEQYKSLVKYYTTLNDATPEGIHALGLKEVTRIRSEMNAVIEEVGFEGSFAEFLKFLRTDPQFYATTAQALMERAAWIAKDIDGRLPGFFGTLPRQPYSVEPVPKEIAENYTTGRYVGAPLQSNIGGQYWVNTYALNKRPLYQLTALTLHEAMPGHHLQSGISKELKNVPEFRKQFYPHAFGEGWGLYSEKLGVEMGVYQTPYEHFGRLSYEMWRACRLVIDTGLHAKGWTRDQAMNYLASNTALSSHNVQTEVDRYIAWPGQALAYKMGELTIWELRGKAQQALGDAFDVREFHDAVLAKGGLPMELLRAQIESYIVSAKADSELAGK
ncbi:MAG: DUF885 family protein [Pseudomonadales bacterium]